MEEDRGQPSDARRRSTPAERGTTRTRSGSSPWVAGWMEKDYPIPDDEADLAPMIDRGEMVEVPAFSK